MTCHDALHAWVEGRHAGVFERNDGIVPFTCDEGMEHPIRLSMPRAGGWARKAPSRFLDNLLLDDPSMRTVMAISTQSPSADAFDLLDRADTRPAAWCSAARTNHLGHLPSLRPLLNRR